MRATLTIVILGIVILWVLTVLKWQGQKLDYQEKINSLEIKNTSYVIELHYADSLLREYQSAYKDCSEFNDKLVNYLHIKIDNEFKARRNEKADQ